MMRLSDLNPEQREAATTLSGPLLVLAGAGTGKTRVITYRIANLLRNGVKPQSVLAVTFTNKAAREMRERVAALVPKGEESGLTVSTFHSFGLRVLREQSAAAELKPRFTIYATSDQLMLIRESLSEVLIGGIQLDAFNVLNAISRAKNAGISPEEMQNLAGTDVDALIGRCYAKYQAKLRAKNAVDFDDLILLPRQLLKSRPDIRAAYVERYQYILIDEYQDTNDVQHDLVRLLAGTRHHVCAVGDDDQSIYAWRGAKPQNVIHFQRDFPSVKLVKLERNYRSTAPILSVANEIIGQSTQRIVKRLYTDRQGGLPVELYEVEDELEEVDMVVKAIRDNHLRKKIPLGHHAILYRANAQSRLFEERLREWDVPYVIVGGQSFYERREVQDILAYLRVLANPSDDVSFRRIVNTPPRGLGQKALEALEQIAAERRCAMRAALEIAAGDESLSRPLQGPIRRFHHQLAVWAEAMQPGRRTEALGRMLEDMDYKAELARVYKKEEQVQQRWENAQEVVNSLAHFDTAGRGDLSDFLASTTLDESDEATARESQLSDHAVTLITIHSCKGLEFPHVYLVGCEEGFLPHKRSIDDEEDMESLAEERRLCYVAVTRAKDRLTLLRAKTRTKRGRPVETVPSRFFQELPPKLIVRHTDGRYRSGDDTGEIAKSYFERMRARLDSGKE